MGFNYLINGVCAGMTKRTLTEVCVCVCVGSVFVCACNVVNNVERNAISRCDGTALYYHANQSVFGMVHGNI